MQIDIELTRATDMDTTEKKASKAFANASLHWRSAKARSQRRCLLCGKPVAATQTFCMQNCAAGLPIPRDASGMMSAHFSRAI
jgi:hypothetical protein